MDIDTKIYPLPNKNGNETLILVKFKYKNELLYENKYKITKLISITSLVAILHQIEYI